MCVQVTVKSVSSKSKNSVQSQHVLGFYIGSDASHTRSTEELYKQHSSKHPRLVSPVLDTRLDMLTICPSVVCFIMCLLLLYFCRTLCHNEVDLLGFKFQVLSYLVSDIFCFV